jgi:arylsulfatase A-like enzyme
MKRPVVLFDFALAAAVSSFACGGGASPGLREGSSGVGSAMPRNLVLIVVDTLRQDHLPSYGYGRNTAPALSRLAAEGCQWDGISPTSWTKPAVASLVSGLHPLRHQTLDDDDRLPEGARTLAERLRSRGYRTLGITANDFVGGRYGFARGYDEYISMRDIGRGRFARANTVNQDLMPKLASLEPPFFLYVHYLDPHAPYEPLSQREAWALMGYPPRPTVVSVLELEMENFMERPATLLRDAADLYDGEVWRADKAIGELLDRLESLSLMDSTLTIVTSDHGEEFQEHGRIGHGQSLYEEVVKVPIVFHAPGVVAPGQRRGAMSLLDILPTALSLLGIGVPDELDGVDLATSMTEGVTADDLGREMLLHLDFRGGRYLALRTATEKLVVGRDPYRKELFDLAGDPKEKTNLLRVRPPASFARLAQDLAAEHNRLASRALPVDRSQDDAETREAMAALGYLRVGSQKGRVIPARIAAAAAQPDGLLGWEDPAGFRTCVETADQETERQLLLGWYPPEEGGRWTWPSATVALRLPRLPDRIVRLRGEAPGSESARIRVFLDDRRLADLAIRPGPFALELPAGAPRTPASGLLRLERSSAFRLPPKVGQTARREVGLFLSSVCVVAGRAETTEWRSERPERDVPRLLEEPVVERGKAAADP